MGDPDMHHGTCVTHVPWCMPGSLTSVFLWIRWRGKTFPAFPAHAQPAILRIWQEAHWESLDLQWHKCCCTVYTKKYAHGFVVLCFVVVMQSFIMNSHEVFIHINQGCFAGTGAIVRLPQCQWSKPDGYGKISQCITTTKHSKAKTVCIFLGIYCKCYICICIYLFMIPRSTSPQHTLWPTPVWCKDLQLLNNQNVYRWHSVMMKSDM